MSEKEMLLVMTIVRLITSKTPSAKEVEKAHEEAIKSLDRRDRGPQNAR